jgi:transposase
VWLFSLILGYSRLIWARFVQHQDLQTVLRCHRAAFTTLGGVPRTILYDRMKTVVTGEPEPGHIVYNRHLVDFAAHHDYQPRACRPYRPKTKGKVERPDRYVRQDFFLARTFRNLDDLNAQLARWLDEVANPRVNARSFFFCSVVATRRSSSRPSPKSGRISRRSCSLPTAPFSGSSAASRATA